MTAAALLFNHTEEKYRLKEGKKRHLGNRMTHACLKREFEERSIELPSSNSNDRWKEKEKEKMGKCIKFESVEASEEGKSTAHTG